MGVGAASRRRLSTLPTALILDARGSTLRPDRFWVLRFSLPCTFEARLSLFTGDRVQNDRTPLQTVDLVECDGTNLHCRSRRLDPLPAAGGLSVSLQPIIKHTSSRSGEPRSKGMDGAANPRGIPEGAKCTHGRPSLFVQQEEPEIYRMRRLR